MLASVSPASYLAMMSGQSDWGILPLLFDFSITKTLEPHVIASLLCVPAAPGGRLNQHKIIPLPPCGLTNLLVMVEVPAAYATPLPSPEARISEINSSHK